jgi:hypothetical protein
VTLAACGTSPKGSVVGSEAGALKAPEFAVKGATDFDQRWIDETTEAGVASLGWKRPEARPPEWDKPLSRDVAAPAPAAEPAKAKPVKKKHWWNRLRRKAASS